MNLREKLEILMKEKDISKADLARATQIPYTTLDGILKRDKFENVKFSVLKALCEYFDVDMRYLCYDEINDPDFNGSKNIRADNFEASGLNELYHPTHRIPILGYVAAGLPLLAEEHIEGYTYTMLNGGAEYFALRVHGDSMNAAMIPDGSIVIVRKQEIVENGQIAVVMVDLEDATVKRYRRDGNIVMLLPQSSNPMHQPQVYDLTETKINILGLVVECKIDIS